MEFRFTLDNATKGSLPLETEPVGFDDTEINLQRDKELIGIFSSYVLKLRFIDDGYEYLKDIFDTQGFEADVSLLIEYREEFEEWKPYIKGLLDMSSIAFDDLLNDVAALSNTFSEFLYAEVALLPNGLETKLRNRRDIPIDISRTTDVTGISNLSDKGEYGGTFGFALGLHSKKILYYHVFGFDTDEGDDPYRYDIRFDASFVVDDIAHAKLPFVPLRNEQGELQPAEVAFESDRLNLNPILVSEFGGVYTLKIKYKGTVRTGLENLRFGVFSRIKLAYGQDANSNDTDLFTTGTISSPDAERFDDFDIDTTYTFTLKEGEGIWVWWQCYGFNVVGIVWEVTSEIANFEVTNLSQAPASWARSWLVYEALATQLEAITEQNNVLISEFFGRVNSQPRQYNSNGGGSLVALTNGYLLRALPELKNPIIPFKELYDSLNSIYNLGMGIDEINDTQFVRIEPKSYFFGTNVIHEFTNVANIKASFSKDFIYNLCEFGYETYEFDTLKSLDDVHGYRKYYNFLKKVKQEAMQKSKIVASAYSLEITRRLQFINNQEDGSDHDDKVFMVCLGNRVKARVVAWLANDTVELEAISQGTFEEITLYNVGANNGTYTVLDVPYFSDRKTVVKVSPNLPSTLASLIGEDSYAEIFLTSGYAPERNENFTLVENVIDADSYYNLRVTPTRNMLKWSNLLNVGMYKYLSEDYYFADGKSNFKAVTNMAVGQGDEILGINIGENAQFDAGDLLQPLFEPIELEFESPLSVKDFHKIKANPYQLIALSDTSNNKYEGYLLAISFNHSRLTAKLRVLKKG